MKIFHCDKCDQMVYFENVFCVGCGSTLAYLPDVDDIASLEPAPDGFWQRHGNGARYRMCTNYAQHQVCNWAIPVEDPNDLCPCCQLNRVVPDLNIVGNQEAWARVEVAKRRLVYSLRKLGLPVVSKVLSPDHGIAFDFLGDVPGFASVLTGHDEGVITLNIAEADDAEREKRRLALHEPYRTVLGHFRHEIGHYYWDQLILPDPAQLEAFRALFGDERFDYDIALQQHYQNGVPANWQNSFITSYATAHPWEDWAETWAHYMHMADTIETAATCGLSMHPDRANEPSLEIPNDDPSQSFRTLMDSWFPLTYVLNNLNRGLGLSDGYPFVLSSPAIEKLRFVHNVIVNAKTNGVPHLTGEPHLAGAS
jgi:hypothetical protein